MLRKTTHVAAFYFDIAKAFDTVWHNGLVWKLIRAGFPAAFCRTVILSARTFCVRVGDSYSTERNICRGEASSETRVSTANL